MGRQRPQVELDRGRMGFSSRPDRRRSFIVPASQTALHMSPSARVPIHAHPILVAGEGRVNFSLTYGGTVGGDLPADQIAGTPKAGDWLQHVKIT
ncbi:hypothetical protein VP1G_11168 [Cytospora mali]|uniref:Uncharacterized protein n=1 Tax=Cytospora mali TaxID=578113 RepID=A0A194V893_CYTMA|nr:hypothetical protein VP1G_11168 [Valsa mali var. pyri (nom. inval.)]